MTDAILPSRGWLTGAQWGVLAVAVAPVYAWVVIKGRGFAGGWAKLIAGPPIAAFLLIAWPAIAVVVIRDLLRNRRIAGAVAVVVLTLAYGLAIGYALYAWRQVEPVRVYAEDPRQ